MLCFLLYFACCFHCAKWHWVTCWCLEWLNLASTVIFLWMHCSDSSVDTFVMFVEKTELHSENGVHFGHFFWPLCFSGPFCGPKISISLCISVCSYNKCWTKLFMTYICYIMVHLDLVQVMFIGQGHRSQVKVTEGNCSFSVESENWFWWRGGKTDLNWKLQMH